MEELKERSRPLIIERLALVSVFLAGVAHSLTRVDMTDTPWHLATARLAFSGPGFFGTWPIQNTFSYSFPEYPLQQQYPLYQSLLYAVHSIGSWEALSILHCLAWLICLALWIRWAGGFRAACGASLLWMFVVFGLQQRMLLRPDMLTMPLLVLMLLCFDAYRASGCYRYLFGIIGIQWAMVNSHQMFILGFALQFLFVIHVFLKHAFASWGEAEKARLRDVVLCLLASAGVLCLNPLGWRLALVPFATLESLAEHRSHVMEFAPLVEVPYALSLVLIALLLSGLALWRVGKRSEPFEVFVWLMFLGIGFSAWRGAAFFIALAGALSVRWYLRSAPQSSLKSRGLGRRKLLTLTLTFSACIFVLYFRWVKPVRGLSGVQPGIGQTLGQWPDGVIGLLKSDPPPGRMLNLGWYSANVLIWELYPRQKVLVDPRFEAYPREFLLRSIAAEKDSEVLDALIDEYQAAWIVAELRLPQVQKRVAELISGGNWELIAFDPVFALLLKITPETEEYRAKLGADLSRYHDYQSSSAPIDIQEAQQARVERFLAQVPSVR